MTQMTVIGTALAIAIGLATPSEAQQACTVEFHESANVATIDSFDRPGRVTTLCQPPGARLLIRTDNPIVIRGELQWDGYLCIASSASVIDIQAHLNGQWVSRSDYVSGSNAGIYADEYRYTILMNRGGVPDGELLGRQCNEPTFPN